jgi:excisionase family DNA binding protein
MKIPYQGLLISHWTGPGRDGVMTHVTTWNDLAGQVFADVPQVASILGRDERTIRRAIEAGKIPGQKVGSRWAIPVAWLREQANVPEPSPDMDELADQVADRVVARLAALLAQAGDSGKTA